MPPVRMTNVCPIQAIPRNATCFKILYMLSWDRKPGLMTFATSASAAITPYTMRSGRICLILSDLEFIRFIWQSPFISLSV